MHISEGILSPGLLAGGALVTACFVAKGLKEIENEDIPKLGILSAAFFVASLIHIPVGPVSAHLILNGLLGIILGWKAFPAIFTGLLLQALLFQFGGITSLGINTLIMAIPAITCYYLFGWSLNKSALNSIHSTMIFLAGACGVMFSGLIAALSLTFTGEEFVPAAKAAVVAHIPVMIAEGILTATIAIFIKKVKPELLEGACNASYK